jgi:AP2 domain
MTSLSDTVAPKSCICGDPACTILHGECHCGCGGLTQISKANNSYHGYVEGQPRKYIYRHAGSPRIDFTGATPFRIGDDYCLLIHLGGRWFCIVDAHRHEELKILRWFPDFRQSAGVYARRWVRGEDGAVHGQALHEYLRGKLEGKTVDHSNGNTADDRMSNLRFADPREQTRNQKKSRIRKMFTYKGIRRNLKTRKIEAVIYIPKQTYISSHDTPEEAARAYDRAAIYYFGEYARLNFPRSDYENHTPVALVE